MTTPVPQATAPQGSTGPRANFGQRLAAILIDTVIVLVVFGILVGIGAAISKGLAIVMYIIGFVIVYGYYVYFEGSASGQTIGKKVMGIRVIDFNAGAPIGMGRAFIRQLGRIASGALCYLGYLWMLWDKEKQTWHDKIATTVVVPTSAYPVEKWPG